MTDHVKENVALTYFNEGFVHEDPKELSYAQEKVKEDVSLGSGLEAVEKKLEKDGTYSSREQGEADWQLASEADLQDFHYTIFEQKWVRIQGLGSNYKRSGLEFYYVMIFGIVSTLLGLGLPVLPELVPNGGGICGKLLDMIGS
uniref:Uncharacterized protein n=1 Tax=Tanacetum cinerariifolium TaxID=118510 RepID=A0A699H6L5_TANCI|nr:hypothetical protein [Tanacetum cinerariifolium]